MWKKTVVPLPCQTILNQKMICRTLQNPMVKVEIMVVVVVVPSPTQHIATISLAKTKICSWDVFGLTYSSLSTDICTCKTIWENL